MIPLQKKSLKKVGIQCFHVLSFGNEFLDGFYEERYRWIPSLFIEFAKWECQLYSKVKACMPSFTNI